MPTIKDAIPLIDGFMQLQFSGRAFGRVGKEDGHLVRTSPVVGHVILGHVPNYRFVTRSGSEYQIIDPDETLLKAIAIREKYNPEGLWRLSEIVRVTPEEMNLLANCYYLCNERCKRER